MEQLTTDALAKIVTNQTAERPPGPPLPDDYQLGPLDICNGRGKSHWNLAGNVNFRYVVVVVTKWGSKPRLLHHSIAH
jgi:hypothetical protein